MKTQPKTDGTPTKRSRQYQHYADQITIPDHPTYTRVLHKAVRYVNDAGTCFPSYQEIMAEVGCSRRTVGAAIEFLEQRQICKTKRRGNGQSNTFTFDLSVLMGLALANTISKLSTRHERELRRFWRGSKTIAQLKLTSFGPALRALGSDVQSNAPNCTSAKVQVINKKPVNLLQMCNAHKKQMCNDCTWNLLVPISLQLDKPLSKTINQNSKLVTGAKENVLNTGLSPESNATNGSDGSTVPDSPPITNMRKSVPVSVSTDEYEIRLAHTKRKFVDHRRYGNPLDHEYIKRFGILLNEVPEEVLEAWEKLV